MTMSTEESKLLVRRYIDVEHGGAANMLEPFLQAGAIQVVGPGQ